MNKLFTWLVGLANPLWRRLGADPNALRLILTAKLIMDDRGGAVMGRRQTQKKGMEWFLYLMLFLFGCGLVILPYWMTDKATAIGLVYSVWMIYIGLLLITEMSENLFDQRDLYVLLSRPINDVTLSLSRILHIAVFSAKFALLLGGPVGVYVLIGIGVWPFVIYVLLGVLAVVLTMTGTLVSYLILLRRVPKHKLKQIVGYFQMVATGIFFFAYQLPNLFGGSFEMLDQVHLVDTAWGFIFPGLWLGGLFKLLTFSGPGALAILQGLIGLGAAAFGLWFYIRESRDYASNLLELREVGSSDGPTNKDSPQEEKASPMRDRLAGWLTKPDLGRVSFRFHWNMMVRDMGFKQRTLPAMVYLPILLILFNVRDAFQEDDFALGTGTIFILLYFIAWIIIIPLGQVKISDEYRASWIFMAAGNEHPERLRYGQLMAVLGMFFLPTALFVYTATLIFWGGGLWVDIILSAGNVLFATFVYHAVDKDLPFGRSKEDAKFSNFGPMLLVSLAASIMGGGHYFISDYFWLKIGLSVLIWIAVIGWLRWMRK